MDCWNWKVMESLLWQWKLETHGINYNGSAWERCMSCSNMMLADDDNVDDVSYLAWKSQWWCRWSSKTDDMNTFQPFSTVIFIVLNPFSVLLSFPLADVSTTYSFYVSSWLISEERGSASPEIDILRRLFKMAGSHAMQVSYMSRATQDGRGGLFAHDLSRIGWEWPARHL